MTSFDVKILYFQNIFILIPGNVTKKLGSGFRFLAGSGINEYGSETLGTQWVGLSI